MSFLFVDRIFAIDPGKSASGLKHIVASDEYLYKNSHGQYALYSCIIGEAIGQLCSWNVIQGTNYGLRLIGGVVGEVKLHRDPLLGETVILENTIDVLDVDNNVCNFRGIARVGDEIILELNDGLGPIMAIAEFGASVDVEKAYQSLYRPGEEPKIQEGKFFPQTVNVDENLLNYDRILEWESGKKLVAQKNISMTAPYFKDHFPQKPVLPVTLMVQANLLLGYEFLAECLPANVQIKSRSVRRVKMNDFVPPGTIVITQCQMKQQTEQHVVLSFRSEAEGKRICTCEAEFEVIPANE